MKISRRRAGAEILASTIFPATLAHAASTLSDPFGDLKYPSIPRLSAFGYVEPNSAQKAVADAAIAATPSGPKPIDIAQSFIDRFSNSNPDLISQWPVPRPWNPLVVTFFEATDKAANNDMVPWCAAFVNWCIQRSGRMGSHSSGAQSFLNASVFPKVADPIAGDLVVFTCYDKVSNLPSNLGHVAFVKLPPVHGAITVVGGNQSRHGTASMICEKAYPLAGLDVYRTIGPSQKKLFTMRPNAYFRIG